MRAEEEDTVIFVKDVLSAGSVVDIPVNDQHAFKAKDLLCESRSQSDVVEEAKAHSIGGAGMVPRRPNEAECCL